MLLRILLFLILVGFCKGSHGFQQKGGAQLFNNKLARRVSEKPSHAKVLLAADEGVEWVHTRTQEHSNDDNQVMSNVEIASNGRMDMMEQAAAASTQSLVVGVTKRSKKEIDRQSRPASLSDKSGDDGNRSAVIPWQLITTGKAASFDELPSAMRENVEHTLSLNPGIKMHYFSDGDCQKYIKTNFDDELASIYRNETHGEYRGDICRAAVLFHEGGFYTDIDLEVKKSFLDMVDRNTTFMSALNWGGDIYNALIGTTPRSHVFNNTLQEVRSWYKGPHMKASECVRLNKWMGTSTLKTGVESVLKANCQNAGSEKTQTKRLVKSSLLQFSCGLHTFRFYREYALNCKGKGETDESSRKRCSSSFDGLKYGLYDPDRKELVAYSRMATCTNWLCGGR